MVFSFFVIFMMIFMMMVFIFFVVFVNGKICKDLNMVIVDDFFFFGLNVFGNMLNFFGFFVSIVNVDLFLGFNIFGIFVVCIDYEFYGVNLFYLYFWVVEFFVVVEGILYMGFVILDFVNLKLFSKILYLGDFFVFLKGFIYF